MEFFESNTHFFLNSKMDGQLVFRHNQKKFPFVFWIAWNHAIFFVVILPDFRKISNACHFQHEFPIDLLLKEKRVLYENINIRGWCKLVRTCENFETRNLTRHIMALWARCGLYEYKKVFESKQLERFAVLYKYVFLKSSSVGLGPIWYF